MKRVKSLNIEYITVQPFETGWKAKREPWEKQGGSIVAELVEL